VDIRDSEDRGRSRPGPAESWPATQLSIRDASLAVRLAEGLDRDGWRVGWSRLLDGSWEARVSSPSMPVPVRARGLSRVSAISGAHLEAIRRAGLASQLAEIRVGWVERSEPHQRDGSMVGLAPLDPPYADLGSIQENDPQPEIRNRRSEFLDMNDLFDLV
jgi:hypothetical protein